MPDNIERKRAYNRAYMREHQRNLYIERRLWLKELMATRGCAHCGIKDHRVLDWAHLPNTGKIECVTKLILNYKKLMLEISKCIILCANCHRIFDYKEPDYGR